MGAALDTISYGCGDSEWKDLLTSYDGQLLASDEIGNLANDGTWSYSWQHGRQLAQMSRPDASGDTEMIRFRYDSGGHRIGKDSGVYHASYSGGEIVYAGETTRTSYSYLGDTLTQVRIVEPNSSATLHFTYDEIGPMSVTYDGAEYFYLKNAQGDVTGLVNSSGTQVVAYTYDAWGNPLTTTGTMADTLGNLNPFRYRGYVYDTETGLYYLQSRYYNPETGRFINADGYVSTGQGTVGNNMFTYCGNNPQSRADPRGCFWKEIGGFFKGVARKFVRSIKSFFGVRKSTTIVEKEETTVIPDPLPITLKYGVKTSTAVSSFGDDSRPISAYQQTVANDFASSTVGIKANIGKTVYDYSVGINNSSVSYSICEGNTIQKIALRANAQELKIGLEFSTTVKWDGYSTTTYTNVSANAWFIVVGYYLITSGQWVPTPSYVS